MGHLLFTTRCTRAQIPVKKQPTLAESFNKCNPYDKKEAQWTAFKDAVTLHITTDMVPVYTVEKLEVHPHAGNFWPQVCGMKQQWGVMSQDRGSRQARLPCQKDSEHTPHVLYIYQHVVFTMQCMQMFNLVYISSGIQNTVCKQKVPVAKKSI